MSDRNTPSPPPTIDAYMHVGSSRYGSWQQALEICDRWGTEKAVLVLGPGVPDIAVLYWAQKARPDAIRTIGIPYGATAENRLACARACFAAGAIGLRLQQNEPLENEAIMAELGERGGCAYATDPLISPEHTAFYVDWLAHFPAARIAAPHFLGIDLEPLEHTLAQELLRHPRFYPIFSRQGQKGSQYPYPFAHLLPWVEHVLDQCGPDRVLWGSEYPVIYWRGEQIDQTRRWLGDLGTSFDDEAYAAYTGGNAQRLFFKEPPAALPDALELPAWLRDFPAPRPVALAPTDTIDLPIEVYQPLFDDYIKKNKPEAPLSFGAYCVEQLRMRAHALEREQGDPRFALCGLEE